MQVERLEELRKAKAIAMGLLSRADQTHRFKRFAAHSQPLDHFLLAANAYFDELFRERDPTDSRPPISMDRSSPLLGADRRAAAPAVSWMLQERADHLAAARVESSGVQAISLSVVTAPALG